MQPHASISLTLGLALWAGVMTLSLARRLKVPPLLFYLLVGLALGPSGIGWIQPKSLGEGLSVLVEFGVAFILFEGALNLPSSRTRGLPTPSRRLLGISMPLTAILSTLVAHYLGDLSWLPAACFGAIVVVTGPTTIGPLLRNLSVGRRLDVLFRHEAIWGDCLGILMAGAILPFWVQESSGSFLSVPYLLAEKAALAAFTGLALGFVLGRWLLPALARLGDPELPGMAALGCAALAFAVGQAVSPGSGPIASAVAGFALALHKGPFVREVRTFKGQVASLFIAMFFVLLSALIDLGDLMGDLGQLSLLAIVLGIFVRPAAIFAGMARTSLSWRERLYLSLVGPRGIVALATASYAVTQRPDDPEAARVFALTFMIIFFSGSFASLLGKPLARAVGVTVPEPRTGILIVGANPFSLAFARGLSRLVPVRIVDSDPAKVESARADGLDAVRGDALDETLYDEATEEGYHRVFASTPNDALNRAILEAAEHAMGRNRLFRVLNRPSEALHTASPHIRHNIAFGLRVSQVEILEEWRRWRVAEVREMPPGAIPLASEKMGGYRILRADSPGHTPWLVLERTEGA